MSYQSGKDSSAEQTIQKARNLLFSMGLFPHETFWAQHAKNCYNVRLDLDGFQETGVNGKGVNRSYALASAYGELMERLQCGVLIKPKFGAMNQVSVTYPDSKNEEATDLIHRRRKFFERMYKINANELLKIFEGVKLNCLPFYHVNSKREVYLPKNLMVSVTDTNGMCAGNTASEALVQGFSEIIERYVSKQINNLNIFPEIPIEKVTNSILKAMIDDILDKGYKLAIKDFTLGGEYPCLGVLIMDINTMSYFISIGVHPIFDIALQRCITEAFQVHQVQSKMHPLIDLFTNKNSDYVKQFVLGAHKGSMNLLESNNISTVYQNAFVENYSSNDEMLKIICNKLLDQNYDIYIKDMSYLGFPSFYIYVNGMSELNEYTAEKLKNVFSNNIVSKYILNLKQCNNDELHEIALKMSELDEQFIKMGYSSEPKLRNKGIFSMLSVIFQPGTDFNELLQDIDYFLTLLYNRLADYEKAYSHLKKFIDRKSGNLQGNKYFLCALHFLKLRAQGENNIQEIRRILEYVYDTTAGEVIEDISIPENAFNYFDLPNCGDCSSCSYSDGRCAYPVWKDFMYRFQSHISTHPVKQDYLFLLFEKISIV